MSSHVVIPGQIIATMTTEEESFLRGHGTYIEQMEGDEANANSAASNIQMNNQDRDDDNDGGDGGDHSLNINLAPNNQHLISSTTGTITRTNKLIQVIQPNGSFAPQTGDPIVGRITSITSTKWGVSLNLIHGKSGGAASLPLTGINLPDGMQRMRTSADALSMREVLKEGDLISAEVRMVQGQSGVGGGGNVVLHARSVRCGRLENGCFVMVPSWLIARRKKHFVVLGANNEEGFDGIQVEVLLGCNGGIWIQRAMLELEDMNESGGILEEVQRIRNDHAKKSCSMEERIVLARVKNAIEALKMVYCRITPEHILMVAKASVEQGYNVVDMLRPDVIVKITDCTRGQHIEL
uniref:Ribosomal RNA-processing protein 4 n=1 Tax=Chaetoceros debilis TaxID=122233 RepID=A0A7S3PVN4_9STRA